MKRYWVFIVWEDWTEGGCKTFYDVYQADSEQEAIDLAKTQFLSTVNSDGKIAEVKSMEF